MCGKEIAGIEAADASIFRDATFIITPLSRTSDAALKIGQSIVAAVGARPLVLDVQRHDQLVAAVSHLPYLLACALVSIADRRAARDAAIWKVAASGYRDTSRLAASDVTMMLDILMTNRKAVVEAVTDFAAGLHELVALLDAMDEEGLRSMLTNLQERRANTPI